MQASTRGGDMNPPPVPAAASLINTISQSHHQHEQVEVASPITSLPPSDELLLAEEPDRSGGNRWPRQETLALLRIRSEMDATFRDATLKGPLWEHVSRKLGEEGYKRSAKKCREKFENVHKYYKRTKEGRASRHHPKTYKFFSELEALQSATAKVSPPPPLPIQNISLPNNPIPIPIPITHPIPFSANININPSSGGATSFSTNSDSSEESGSRKRKRSMMELFEGLMKQVLQRQEAMQQRFLEAVEKREQERVIREEAWKRQEMSRLAREHDLMAQDRAISASRDAAVISFLQKFTGQTIQLPHHLITTTDPISTTASPAPAASVPTRAVPEGSRAQEMSIEGSSSSSRWPKAEVLALINIRSGLEGRYKEAGPKGQLWEEVSAEMERKGYKRSPKRCKEKWENINKYFKKVKESNKKRPDDAKTCPYFHQLDALYRRKTLITNPTLITNQNMQLQQQEEENINHFHTVPSPHDPTKTTQLPEYKNGGRSEAHQAVAANLFGESTRGGKPQDIVKDRMMDHDKNNESDEDEDEVGELEDEDGEEVEEEREYKIEFQRAVQTGAPSNGGGNETPSFLAMVQ